MLSRVRTAALLGLILTGPAVADGPSAARHPVAHINIDALTADSDFTVFMRKDVPEEVRRVRPASPLGAHAAAGILPRALL